MSDLKTKERLIDCQVGKNIRFRRHAKKMTQQQLAEQIGVQFQQLQKYETGENRVSASKLYLIAKALETNVPALFANLDHDPDCLAVQTAVEAEMLEQFRLLGERRRESFLNMMTNLNDFATEDQIAA